LSLTVRTFEARSLDELEPAFAAIKTAGMTVTARRKLAAHELGKVDALPTAAAQLIHALVSSNNFARHWMTVPATSPPTSLRLPSYFMSTSMEELPENSRAWRTLPLVTSNAAMIAACRSPCGRMTPPSVAPNVCPPTQWGPASSERRQSVSTRAIAKIVDESSDLHGVRWSSLRTAPDTQGEGTQVTLTTVGETVAV
jgi:hypothetical protein